MLICVIIYFLTLAWLIIKTMRKKIMLLGSGELGRELVIALQRLGQYVIAVDSYQGAPAMQVAQEYEAWRSTRL